MANSSSTWLIVFLNSLGAFENFRKATISFVMPARPSVRMEQLGSHSKDIREV